jgi:hypothetical protein
MAECALKIFEEQKKFSDGARSIAAHFDVQKITDQYLSIYQIALNRL